MSLRARTLALALALPSVATAQPDVIHQVDRASSPIELDGSVTEPAWSTATRIELAYEVEPGENIEPPVRTTCLITYDDRNVYFAFIAEDPDPSRIRARYSDRDRAWDDDWVGIVLDTFNDERRAYELFSTPLGVQIDAINDDIGRNYDDSWNAIWKSAGRITDAGFEVEMAVPFNQIRFQPGAGEQVWGFDAIRSWPREFRHHIGAFPRDRGANSYLGQAIKIRGMAGADPGSNLEFIPTFTTSRTDSRESADLGFSNGDPRTDIGASLRWGATPNISLNAAVNPDFSQVEADAVQLAVNEQFALFFPETRPFFLEGKDYFNTDLDLVHTRAIVDPDGAGKVTGKAGGHTWAVFSARDNTTSLVAPGVDGSSDATFGMDNWSTVGRYRHDFGTSSTIGATITDRRGGDYSNSVQSADLVYRLTSKDQVRTSFAWSRTEYDDEMRSAIALPDDSIDGAAANFDYEHSERGWWVNAASDHVGEEFRSDLGHRPRVGYNSVGLSGAKIWWGDEDALLTRSAWGARGFHTERTGGGLLERGFRSWINTQGPRQTHASFDAGLATWRYEGRDFDLVDASLDFDSQLTGAFSLGGDFTFGEWIDFAHVRPATRYFARPRLDYTVGRHLRIDLRYTWSRLDVDPGRLFSVHAPEIRLVHQFDARAYVRLVLQYRSTSRDASLYADQVSSRSRSLLTQFLFTYKLDPQTALYAGYGDNQYGDDQSDLARLDRTFFLKLSYAWLR